MAADYKKKAGFDATLLLEPKPQEPTKHQYDWDVATTLGFLRCEQTLYDSPCNGMLLGGRVCLAVRLGRGDNAGLPQVCSQPRG